MFCLPECKSVVEKDVDISGPLFPHNATLSISPNGPDGHQDDLCTMTKEIVNRQ